MKLYMMVTPDEFELPLAVVDNVIDLVQLTGKKKGSILSAISGHKSGTRCGYKLVKVEMDDTEE